MLAITMMKWKVIGHLHMQNIFATSSKFSNKQSAKVICGFDRLRAAHSN